MPTPPRQLTRAQAREVDRLAIEEFGFPGMVLMENAGRGCVDIMQRVGIDGPVLVLAGKGNNAGDGFVIARHLTIRGFECRVALGFDAAELRGDALQAFHMLMPCHIRLLDLAGVHASTMIEELDDFATGTTWLVDALLGTGATGPPRPPLDSLIDWINAESATTLAVDLPSGLDCDTGQAMAPCVRADHTCTFVAPKVGFTAPTAIEVLGEVHTVDIGIPDTVVDCVCC